MRLKLDIPMDIRQKPLDPENAEWLEKRLVKALHLLLAAGINIREFEEEEEKIRLGKSINIYLDVYEKTESTRKKAKWVKRHFTDPEDPFRNKNEDSHYIELA